MKVLYVLNSLAPGGTETSTVQMATLLRRRGVEVSIVVLRPADHELADLAEKEGVSVRRLTARNPLSAIRELRSIVVSARPNIVHTALFDADQIGRLATIGLPVAVVSSLVSTPYDPARVRDPNVQRSRLRLVQVLDSVTGRAFVDAFHAVSSGVRDANSRALRIPCDRIVVAERGRDIEQLKSSSAGPRARARSTLGLSAGSEVVLALGRLEFQKAHVDLIESVKYLRPAHPNLTVLIAGKEGSASPRIRAMLGSDPSARQVVRLLGHRTDLSDLYSAADVLAISSHFEGTAGVALEAMAMELPIVSTDVEGLRGILVDNVNAILVRANDPPDLARGLDLMLSDSILARRLVSQASADFVGRFTLEASADRMMALYETVSQSQHRTWR